MDWQILKLLKISTMADPDGKIGWAAHALSNAIVVAFSLIDLKNEWVARGARLKMDPEQDQNWREDEARFATQT